MDNLGNIYTLKNDELKKFDSKGKLLATYSNKRLGTIDQIDLSDPLRVLLFYKNFSQLVFLDNMLSENLSPVLLLDVGIQQASLACSSHDNSIWVYNGMNNELIWIDHGLKIKQRTGNISRMLQLNLSPNYLTEESNALYLNNPATGILVFDIYGTYYKTIPIKGLKDFQVLNNKLFYLTKGYLKSFGLKTLQTDSIALPDTTIKIAQIQNNNLYLLSQQNVNVYKLE